MLQYLVILLAEDSTSYCHYEEAKGNSLISIDVLRKAVRFAMMENLMVQFVYPSYALPSDYLEVIESVDHVKIMPVDNPEANSADVLIVNPSQALMPPFYRNKPYVWRTDRETMYSMPSAVLDMIGEVGRLNIVLTDVEKFKDEEVEKYRIALERVCERVNYCKSEGVDVQVRQVTDRLLLTAMNNCEAGVTNVTLAPNGKFYICPGFYCEDRENSVGDIENGVSIRNPQLYDIKHAPICQHCDAWQCRRCVWLNKKLTREVNTPSHGQCVMSHVERDVTRTTWVNRGIEKLDYLDPIENMNNWTKQNEI